jgi:hypothetical protein
MQPHEHETVSEIGLYRLEKREMQGKLLPDE